MFVSKDRVMNRQSGFTLLELLVVIGIMGFIAAMVRPMLGTLNER